MHRLYPLFTFAPVTYKITRYLYTNIQIILTNLQYEKITNSGSGYWWNDYGK